MTTPKPLSPEALYQRCDTASFSFDTTAELTEQSGILGQARALDALHFGVGIKQAGFNLYVLGPPGVGKLTAVRQYLDGKAAEGPAPSDWCYVNNFEDINKPKILKLPNGMGSQLRRDMHQLLEDLLNAISAAFESEEYETRIKEIGQDLHDRQEQAYGELKEEAEVNNIALLNTPGGFAFAPMKEGEVIETEDYKKLSEDEQKQIQSLIAGLQEKLGAILRQVPQWRKETRQRVKVVNREIATLAVKHEIDEVRGRYVGVPQVQDYIDAVEKDVMEYVEEFRSPEEGESSPLSSVDDEGQVSYRRYQVNVLVGHTNSGKAPVVHENNPTHGNLIGRVEHQAQMGALLTDFTMIRAGALHCANDGYLILDARKLLTQPYAWEALKRALQSREIRIQSLGEMLSLISTVSIEPEPIPLNIKVVLLGDRLLYYLLCEYDPEFIELFKVAADFDDQMVRDEDNSALYAGLIATLVHKEELLEFDRAAVARVIEHSARLAGDAEKLSTHMGQISDLLREASYWGQQAGTVVQARDVQRAIDEQTHRSDRLRERMHEEIHRGTILIDTEGAKAAQINALSVLQLGNFMFGQPTRITATARLGEGGVLDIEREVELGGPIHSKAVMILSSFLAARYSHDKPLSLQASVVFEQSYGMVEGDSASVAELCVLLSALANIPVKQSLAVTGSVNQQGEVQAIGGVNEKIEGFFDVCNSRGLNGEQGVLIPASNVKHLMLRHDVVEAVKRKQFHIYPVTRIDEAIELLTGVPAGDRGTEGVFAEQTVNRRVEDRLDQLAQQRQAFGEAHKGSDEPGDDE